MMTFGLTVHLVSDNQMGKFVVTKPYYSAVCQTTTFQQDVSSSHVFVFEFTAHINALNNLLTFLDTEEIPTAFLVVTVTVTLSLLN